MFWRGIVYTILRILGKLVCGIVLVRLGISTRIKVPFFLPSFPRSKPKVAHNEKSSAHSATAERQSTLQSSSSAVTTSMNGQSAQAVDQMQSASTSANTSRKRLPSTPNPQSLYPAAMLGSAMVARGEIGFLISSLAESTGVFGGGQSASGSESGSSDMFLIVTWAILLCTVIGPVSVGVMVKRVRRLQKAERESRSGRPDPLGIWGVM